MEILKNFPILNEINLKNYGNLSCLQCQTRIGSYNFSGNKCYGCNQWKAPAIMIIKSKVDLFDLNPKKAKNPIITAINK